MAKRQVGTIIPVIGEETIIRPAKGGKFTLDELQKAVGGDIEVVALAKGNGHATMYVNGDGKGLGLPHNAKATALMSPDHMVGDFVAGIAVVVRTE